MNKFVSFIFGAAIGSIATKLIMTPFIKKKYELYAQREIDEYKKFVKENILRGDTLEEHDRKVAVDAINSFLEANNLGIEKLSYEDISGINSDGAILYPENEKKEEVEKPEKEEKVTPTNYAKIIKESDYGDIEETHDEVLEAVRKREARRGVTYDNDTLGPGPKDIEVISEEEFDELINTDEWDTETVYYQIDEEILMNMGGQIVDEEDIGGVRILEDASIGDIIFIKNKYTKRLIEVEVV